MASSKSTGALMVRPRPPLSPEADMVGGASVAAAGGEAAEAVGDHILLQRARCPPMATGGDAELAEMAEGDEGEEGETGAADVPAGPPTRRGRGLVGSRSTGALSLHRGARGHAINPLDGRLSPATAVHDASVERARKETLFLIERPICAGDVVELVRALHRIRSPDTTVT